MLKWKNPIQGTKWQLIYKVKLVNVCCVQVREVCNLLNKVRETSASGPHPETLDSVNALVHQQETAVAQLDQQRANIVSMLQRGKDLSRDNNAPAFIKEEVNNLESGWNEAYGQTLDKLKKLKGGCASVFWTHILCVIF